MSFRNETVRPTTRALLKRPAVQWLTLILLSAVFTAMFFALRVSAALLLGPMVAGIVIAASAGPTADSIKVPKAPFYVSQALIGCMIAQIIPLSIFSEIRHDWLLFLCSVLSVLIASCTLGYLLTRWQVLPGSTAIWGSFPGAATAMTLMAEAFGEDVRLVAFMLYLRVVFVALVASVIQRIVVGHEGGGAGFPHPAWLQPVHWQGLVETALLVAGGILIARRFRIPAGPMLVPMFVGIALQDLGWMRIELPAMVLALAYAFVGWTIGLRFTRKIIAAAWKAMPRVVLSILTLLAVCGGLSLILVKVAGVDPLTAYLAMSPGGADSVAIIASSSHVDVPFVMSMQIARFLFILVFGPAIAKGLAGMMKRSRHWSAQTASHE